MVVVKKEYNKGRVTLLFDDGSKSIELSKAVVYEEGIKIGSTLTEDQLYNLTLLSEQKRAYHRALYYISKSNMSSGYLRKKLDKKFMDEAIEYAVNKVLEQRFIIDIDYATHLAERLLSVGRSKKEIIDKMYYKGCKKDDIEYALSLLEFDEEADILALINKKYLTKLNGEKGEEKVAAALIRRGFSPYKVKKIIKQELGKND